MWGRDTCVVRLATRNRDKRFRTTLYQWPAAEEDVIKFIVGNEAANNEVYFSPDLFKLEALEKRSSGKDMVLGSRVICLDFDGNAPDSNVWDETGEYEGLPIPSYIVQSSRVENQHIYWILDTLITDIDLLENMRRAITYKLKADGSGWDAGQLLRPPFTTNYGYAKDRTETYDVFIERSTDRVYTANRFAPPKDFRAMVSEAIDTDGLPDIRDTLIDHEYVHGFKDLFRSTLEEIVASGDRSNPLCRVGYYAAESGLSDQEIYVLVQDADRRWGKYVGRTDQHKQLSNIVARARAKHPFGSSEIGLGVGWDGDGEAEVATRTVYSFDEMWEAPFNINWFIPNLLSRTGYALFVGTPGVGKTQILIRLCVAIALGKKFLDWEVDPDVGSQRVMMFALEMNAVGVKKFVNDMTDLEDQRKKIGENFFLYPQDREIYLDIPKSRAVFEQYLAEYKPSLVVIDSLSKAVAGSLNKEEDVRKVNAYLDMVRRKYGCAIIAVHHAKKRQVGDHANYDSDTDYVYGSRFITTDADLVLGFEHTGTKDRIQVSSSKVRYGPLIDPFYITRTSTMNFEMSNEAVETSTLNKAISEGGFLKGFYNHVSDPGPDGKPGPEPTPPNAHEF
jgi:KaiC/GvpD/RAD55 family RecA-like ATPase